jgi:zinc finger CCHC domain-containing protein 9
MTKEERREKYTEIARKKRQKQQPRGLPRQGMKQNVCYQCRQIGHTAVNCPSKAEDGEQQELICYKCGSTEHSLSGCPNRNRGKGCDLPYATCFLCKEKGHLISGCPQNKKGIYINGGSCRLCGSQQHLATVCPERRKKNPKSAGDEDDAPNPDQFLEKDEDQGTKSSKKLGAQKKRRIVKF